MKKALISLLVLAVVLIGCNRNQDEEMYDDYYVSRVDSTFNELEGAGYVSSIDDVTEFIALDAETETEVEMPVVIEEEVPVDRLADLPEEEYIAPPEELPMITEDVPEVEDFDRTYTYVEVPVAQTTTTTVIEVQEPIYIYVPVETTVGVTADAGSPDGQSGAYFEAGDGTVGQNVSPRDYIKMTTVVFNDFSAGDYVDFQLYAVPNNADLNRIGYYMLGYAYNVELVNNQAQLTRYWNGKNVYGNFLPEGNYNLYVYYKIKNEEGVLLKNEGRYWGYSQDFYITLE